LSIIIGIVSFYLIIPPGIPFITPANSLIEQIRSINFLIGVLVSIFLYLNDFSLLESLFVGAFWSAYLAYLVMVPGP
jgi:hypothetical protein